MSATKKRLPPRSLLLLSPIPAPTVTHRAPGIVAFAPMPVDEASAAEKAPDMLMWRSTTGGIKFVDDVVGTGVVPQASDVVSVLYTVSLLDMTLGSNRGKGPLTFRSDKHPVPIFTEAIEGMRVGGRRRLSVPAAMVPESQVSNIPQDQAGEPLRFEIELVAIERGLKAIVPSLLPPGNRRRTIARVLFALSFLPYTLPEDMKPEGYRGTPMEEVVAKHEAAYHEPANLLYNAAGFGASDFNSVFPE